MLQPKFFICTLYCGEPDLPHTLKAISQQGVEIEHRIISYTKEVDAHNLAYQAFNNVDKSFIRAKIDADVVLRPGALIDIARAMGPSTWLDPMTHDYFTDAHIHAGLAFYGPDVKFSIQTDTLKCDRNIAHGAQHVPFGLCGNHAHHASEFNGFHYGFHRGLKSQLPIYEMLTKAYKKHGDRVRLMAIRGFDLGQSDRYKNWHLGHEPVTTEHNYGEDLQRLFEEFSVDNPPSLTRTWR